MTWADDVKRMPPRPNMLMAADAELAALSFAWLVRPELIPKSWLMAATLGVAWFLRNPTAAPLQCGVNDNALYSPADGRVMEVRRGPDTTRVTIFLSVFSVHAQYAPCDATVIRQVHTPGSFCVAYDPCADYNERLVTDLETRDGLPLRMLQITGAVARRTLSFVRPGEGVKARQRIGFIKFGSRVDLIYPTAAFKTLVCPGQYLNPAETVVARRISATPTHRRVSTFA